MNQRELTTESKRRRLSIMRFWGGGDKVSAGVSMGIGEAQAECRGHHHHTYLAALLQQDLVVFAQGDAKYDGRDVLETVDPLFALAALAADVKHAGVGC
jgi:hypothetical protein